MSKKWKKGKKKVTSARQHLLNEHIYMPGIVLRIFHSHHQNLMKWDYPSFQMRKVSACFGSTQTKIRRGKEGTRLQSQHMKL